VSYIPTGSSLVGSTGQLPSSARLDRISKPLSIQIYKKNVKNLVFHESILSYATDLLKVELDAFLLHKDNRTQTNNIRNKAPSTPAFLRMPAADITPKFLESNVLGECEKGFSGSHIHSVVNDTNDTLVSQYCIAILSQSNINPGS
jgi:hypothetical protein